MCQKLRIFLTSLLILLQIRHVFIHQSLIFEFNNLQLIRADFLTVKILNKHT